ncbi:hypothetical protein NHX12_018464 [Muraenolepis orangiensis]|uniref:Rho GTPase-activating protein 7 n=1 Tax=Muraenolepis orangiensis TaxID=630683 RepID=A0A9Q0EWU1_9TELE|nr:hypothetical protein NHX12_018464 [Muraenolepis orangiensis]
MSGSMRWQLLQRSLRDHLRFSSCRALDSLRRTGREGRLAEIEAKEACTWLRAAGFPQYAQLYEDSQFPIDISSVTRDHDFLDRDAIEALCRRLNTLNKCSEDSDEDEPCAISGRWTFQRDSKRWSRLEELEVFSSLAGEEASSSQPWAQSCCSSLAATSSSGTTAITPALREGHSSESVLTDLSEQPEPRVSSRGWRAFVSALDISGPVAREGLDDAKLARLHCVDIGDLQQNLDRNHLDHRQHPGGQTMTLGRGGRGGVPYSTQTSNGSTGSTGSSPSEASGGSTVSTPSPVTRARSHSTAAAGSAKRGGMYLEGFDPFSLPPPRSGSSQTSAATGSTATTPTTPKSGPALDEQNRRNNGGGHKPGTFPRALRDGGGRPGNDNNNGDRDVADANGNPVVVLRGGRQSRRPRRGSMGSAGSDGRLSFYDNNRLEEHGSDQDSTGNPLGEGEDGMRERRDSGVGASLTRTNRPQKFRWPSFQSSHRPSEACARLQIGCQSVLQMNLLQKLSLLTLTALLERHTPTNKHGFSWAVPKFMKRVKVRDYKDKNVFGVPLQVGLFRKSGVKSRIQALRQMNESCGGGDGGGVSYEGQSAYDVADMLKQYFRDLPEPLLTSKLSETFLQIYQYMPKEQRLQAVRAGVLLLPDESREALHTLLCLLSDVTASVAENQMTPTNLAVCLAPSLFHLNTLRRKESSSPRVMNRKQTLGKPDQRDLNENLAATHGLAHMIQECRKLFRIPEEMSRCRNSYVEQALLPRRLEELGGGGGEASRGGYRAYLQQGLDALLKDAKDKFRGYDSLSTPEQAELAYKKVHDDSPLRMWKVSVEVPAGPEEVLTRVLREQGRWDEDLLESRVVETLDERTEVYQYVRASMAPHPTIDHLVLRTWVTDLPKGACALVCSSVDQEGALVLGVRANVLMSRYFIEPCGTNKSRLTHISRTDCRGRFPEWYNKLYGHLCAAEVVRIRDSFTVPIDK